MSRRIFTVVPIAFAFVVGGSLASAQTSFEPPRLADGHVDLQGVWDFRTLTPLQRPEDLADKSLLTAEETAEIESEAVARTDELNAPSELRTEPLPVGGNVGAYNNYWVDQGARVVDDQRTSLIVEPATGRLPPPSTRSRVGCALARRGSARCPSRSRSCGGDRKGQL